MGRGRRTIRAGARRLVAPVVLLAAPAAAQETIVLGEQLRLELEGDGRGAVAVLDVERPEPLTLEAESHWVDVDLAIEAAGGAVLAADEDGGIASNAALAWTPPAPGRYHVRCVADRRGPAGLRVLRGHHDVTPPDPELAERVYWQEAYQRAAMNRLPGRAERMVEAARAYAVLDGCSVDEAAGHLASLYARSADWRSRRLAAHAAWDDGDADTTASVLRDLLDGMAPSAASRNGLARMIEYESAHLAHDARLPSIELDAIRRAVDCTTRIRHAHHVDRLNAQLNLAAAEVRVGDAARALEIDRALLRAFGAAWPRDAPRTLTVMSNLSAILRDRGDVAAARAMQEHVLRVRSERLPEDHPDVQTARENLASTLVLADERDAALRLMEQVVAAHERRPPPMRYRVLQARAQLAWLAGDREAELAAEREILARRLASPDPDPEAVLASRLNLARLERDDEQRLVALEAVLSEMIERVEPVDPWLLGLRREIATAAGALRPRAEAFEQLEALVDGVVTGLTRIGGRDRRERRVHAAHLAHSVHFALGLAGSLEADHLTPSLFTWLALQRHAMVAPGAPAPADADTLHASLPLGDAAVVYARYGAYEPSPRPPWHAPVHLLALVLRPDGSVRRVELGTLDAARAALGRWFLALGVEDERLTAPIAGEAPLDKATASARLHRLLARPVLDAAGPAGTLHVLPDDLVHLVPLDALDALVRPGEVRPVWRRRIALGPAVDTRAVRAGAPPGAIRPATALLVGDADFGPPPDLAATDVQSGITAHAPLWRSSTNPGSAHFAPLPGTAAEIDAVEAALAGRADLHPVRLTGAAATVEAVLAHLPDALVAHIATHGTLREPTATAPQDDPLDGSRAWAWSPRDRVRALSPLSLCGVALAGANRPPGASGTATGILTGERIAELDLSRLELAVLSACGTGSGLVETGFGIESLQAAFHAAGARTTLASLWDVGDRHTRQLMAAFHHALLVDGLGPEAALARARVRLLDRRAPLRDVVAWVLTHR